MRIDVQQIHHHYGQRAVLQEISFAAESGGVIGLLGPNGAGKSTLLKILAGVMPASHGSFTLDNTPCSPTSQNYRAQIGYLPEIPPLYPEMTVHAYLSFCGRLRGFTGKRLTAAIELALARCDLQPVQKRLSGELSSGFQQRVGLAQAILHDPAILILDEPTVGLDPAQIIEIRQLIRALSRDKIILFSTHILSEVSALCDRVMILHHGRILFDGPVQPFEPQDSTVWDYRILAMPPAETLTPLYQKYDGEQTAPDRLRFRRVPDDATAAQLLARLQAAQCLPVEACHNSPSLEQRFIELTCRPLQESVA